MPQEILQELVCGEEERKGRGLTGRVRLLGEEGGGAINCQFFDILSYIFVVVST